MRVIPTGHAASTPGAAVSKSVRAQTGTPDSVELGRASEAPPPRPKFPPADARIRAEQRAVEQRLAIRRKLAPEVSELNRKLRKGELKGEAFQAAARRLADVAHGCGDPLVARMARGPLYGCFEYKEAPYDHVFKLGPIKGPVYALEVRLSNVTGFDRGRYYLNDESVTPFLAALYQVTEKVRPTPEAVAVVARLAHGFYARAAEKLPDGVRQHETPEQDDKWAESCAAVLATWWDEGSLRVVRDGREQSPGSVDLVALLRQRPPALRGTTLDFTRIPSADAPEATELAERISTWKKDPAPGIGELDRLASSDPEKAARVARQFVDLALHPDSDVDALQRVARILEEGSPKVRELFRPELPRMIEMVSEAATRDQIALHNLWGCARAAYYAALVKSFPEVVDESLLQGQLEPLYYAEINTANDLRPTLLEIWDQHPELMAGTVERAIAMPADFYPDREATSLVSAAVKKGWSPTPLQKDWLVSWLYQPCDRKDDRINHNQTFEWALATLGELDKRNPGFLDGVQLPDTHGTLRPLGEALIDRLRHDPEEDPVRTFFSKGDHMLTGSAVSGIYALAFPNDKLTAELLDLAEAGYRRTGDCNKMNREEQTAMVILGSQDLPGWADQRLRSLLAGERYRDQGWYVYNDIVGHYRQGFQAEALGAVKAPDSTTQQRIEGAREYLKMGVGRISDYDLDRYYEGILPPLQQALSPGEGPSAFRSLLGSALKEAGRVEDLATMSLDGISDLVLARALAAGRPELEAELGRSVRPLLGKTMGYQPAVRHVLDPFRDRAIDDNLRKLAQPASAAQRAAIVEENLAMAKATYQEPELTRKTLETWSQGPTEPWAQSLISRYQEPAKSWQAVAAVAAGRPEPEPAKRAERYLELFEKLGRENYHDNVLKAFDAVSAALARGQDRTAALEAALKQYLVGPAPTEAPDVGDIRKEGTRVHVGAVSLPIRPNVSE